LRATPDAETIGALQKLFGPAQVRLVRAVAPASPEPDPRDRWRQ
jgi:hypothetical protein